MRIGKRERVVLREKERYRRICKERADSVGPFVPGICSSYDLRPVEQPCRKWVWDWREDRRVLRHSPGHSIRNR